MQKFQSVLSVATLAVSFICSNAQAQSFQATRLDTVTLTDPTAPNDSAELRFFSDAAGNGTMSIVSYWMGYSQEGAVFKDLKCTFSAAGTAANAQTLSCTNDSSKTTGETYTFSIIPSTTTPGAFVFEGRRDTYDIATGTLIQSDSDQMDGAQWTRSITSTPTAIESLARDQIAQGASKVQFDFVAQSNGSFNIDAQESDATGVIDQFTFEGVSCVGELAKGGIFCVSQQTPPGAPADYQLQLELSFIENPATPGDFSVTVLQAEFSGAKAYTEGAEINEEGEFKRIAIP